MSDLLVEGHICWNEDISSALLEGTGSDVWRLELEVAQVLLLCWKRILSDAHRGTTRQRVAVPVLKSLRPVEG